MLQTPTATGVEGTRGTAGPGPRGTRGRRDLAFLKSRMQFDWVKIQQALKRCDFNAVNSELEIVSWELHARLVSQV